MQIDEYIASFPIDVQDKLGQIRELVRKIAPNAEEHFAYSMPAYKVFGKPLVYYAGYKNHIGLYATPSSHSAFQKDLARYKQGKGFVQFPLNQELPLELIRRMVEHRLKQIKESK